MVTFEKVLKINDVEIEIYKFYKIQWNSKSGGWPEEIGRISGINFGQEKIIFDYSGKFISRVSHIPFENINSIELVEGE